MAPNLLTPVVENQDKQPAQGSSIMLPPEISSLVCGFLPKQGLKRVRQVSKTWEQAAVPYLFDEIFISQNMADIRIAKLVILQFKYYIRTLVLSSVYYKYMCRESFDEYLDEESDIDTDTDVNHSDHAFMLYHIARKNQRENLTNASFSAHLSFALTSSPNIRKIILTDTSSSRSMSCQSLQVYEPRRSEPCPAKRCILEDTKHFHQAVRQSGFSRSGSDNPWRLILQALPISDLSVSELTMLPEDCETTVDTSVFSMSQGELSQAKLCFHPLTKIRLALAWNPKRFSTDFDIRCIHPNVAKLLRCAVKLECLALVAHAEHDSSKVCPLQDALRRCRFPELKSLILGFFEFTEVELLSLLTHSPKLQQLTIEFPILKEGSWMRIVDWARASLASLKNAQLNHLYGGLEDPWADTEYIDVYGHISEFLFAQGENPFTKEALAKYHADIDVRREMVIAGGGESLTDICDRYH